ncbi:MAG: hypothetical protein DRG11_01310 [Epsilonproteobacteria bacterium]|nr:MAG: hypothetical protein DRG11_01310 [Campylobacterota bacterium]
MNSFEQISFEEFKDNFEPIQNFIDDEAGMDGMLFDICGEELNYVKEESSSGTVWTLIEKHKQRYILEGFHIKDRVGYIITAIPNTNINIKLEVIFEKKKILQEQQVEVQQTKQTFLQKLFGIFR